jgi:hypothetical protein
MVKGGAATNVNSPEQIAAKRLKMVGGLHHQYARI